MRNFINNPLKYKEKPSKEDLYELYINQNKSIKELQSIFHRSEGWLLNLFKYYNIKKPKSLIYKKVSITIHKIYGIEGLKNKKIRQKTVETCLKRYGVTCVNDIPEAKVKRVNTLMKNYGVPHSFQSEIVKSKIKETLMKKYKVTQIMNNKEIAQKCGTTHKINHWGAYKYNILENKANLEKFIQNSNVKNAKYLSNKLECSYSKFENSCKRFNLWGLLNHSSSSYENEIKDIFENVGITMKKDRTLIYPLELDLLSNKYKFAIEFNGDYWHKDKPKGYHNNKTMLCKNKGVRLFHIWEHDWIKPDNKKEILYGILKYLETEFHPETFEKLKYYIENKV